MPVCYKHSLFVNYGRYAQGNGKVVQGDDTGYAPEPRIQPPMPYQVTPADGIESCDAVALTAAEYQKIMSSSAVQVSAWQELGNMSIENAQVISAYIAAVWAIAWGLRAIRKSISTFESADHE